MPTYEYHCPKCKATYELRQGFDAETTQTCEECGKGIAKRVLHAPPVMFKGSGWYVTDSKSKSRAAVTDAKGDGESSGDSSDGGGESSDSTAAAPVAEAAPAAKPEKKAKAAAKSDSGSSGTAAAS